MMIRRSRSATIAAVTLLGAWCTAPAIAQTILHVDADATGPVHDGTSWCDAYLSLQDALTAALPGTEIRVADGIYTPAIPNGSRTTSFRLKSGVAILGGFAGCGAGDPDLRAPLVLETILSGDLNDDDDSGGSNGENSYHVVAASGVDATAVLDGVTITGGHANGSNPCDRGGGIFLFPLAGSPTIRHCMIRDNVVLTKGGGIYAFDNTGIVADCVIRDNFANDGGGVYNLQGSPTYDACTISGNTASTLGGGVFNLSSDASFTSCVLADNQALGGGGMYSVTAEPIVSECLFLRNRAENGFNSTGGGLQNQESGGLIVDTIFNGNIAENRGGGTHNTLSSFATFANCVWVHNHAGAGGGLTSTSSDTAVLNSILWANSDDEGSVEPAQLRKLSGALSLDYSCVQGFSGVLEGTGNIGDDPLFADANGDDDTVATVDDDLHLTSASPCVNTGDPVFEPPINSTDFDGNERVFCERIDMGPFELQDPATCIIATIPTVSAWGLFVLLLGLAILAKLARLTPPESYQTVDKPGN